MTKSTTVSGKYFKILRRLFAASFAAGLLLPAGAVLACGGGSCTSHAQHKAGSGTGHDGHTTPPVVTAANQESPDVKSEQMSSLMNVPIFINDPGALLAQAEALGLSEEQKARIQAVQKEAAAKAAAVLTDEQRQRLGDVADHPFTPVQICSSICPYKQNKAAGSQAGEEQTVCPVMGGKINKEVSTDYKGKKVYFCCPGCIAKFEAEPEKYLAKPPASGEPQFQKPQTQHPH